MDLGSPELLTGCEARRAMAAGTLDVASLVAACLARIEAREPAIHAWAHLDRAAALAEARRLDGVARRGPLHGMPIGIKDVIDTEDMPTGYGSAVFDSHRPQRDAVCIGRLRGAGAVILGKTATAEFATYHPPATDNPAAPGHTPGGSSSGSAAAVADHHVPVALGTQTAGSIVRPASFCGVFGFKPSFGRYPTEGVLETASHLDTVGLFARSIEDLLAVDRVLAPDADDALGAEGPIRVAICRTPAWGAADAAMRAALGGMVDTLKGLGVAVTALDLPPEIAGLIAVQILIHKREAWASLGAIRADHADRVSAAFRRFIDDGAAVAAADYTAALGQLDRARAGAADLFRTVDLLLTPGAPGPAPAGLDATGDPIFNRLWTALGTPCLGFPAGRDASGRPLGLQLIGPPGRDRVFLRNAERLLALACDFAEQRR